MKRILKALLKTILILILIIGTIAALAIFPYITAGIYSILVIIIIFISKEQEEAIKYFEDKIKDVKPEYIETYVDGKKYRIEVIPVKMRFDKEEAEKMKIILNMLKEKDAEIEKYKKLLADNLARELNNSIKAKEKADTDLDDLDKGWKVELEKKDKMIDLILDKFKEGTEYYYSEFDYMTKEDLKQYFERKVEDD